MHYVDYARNNNNNAAWALEQCQGKNDAQVYPLG
jgi:hypothetical protein